MPAPFDIGINVLMATEGAGKDNTRQGVVDNDAQEGTAHYDHAVPQWFQTFWGRGPLLQYPNNLRKEVKREWLGWGDGVVWRGGFE